MENLVSVIIPTFSRPRMLGRAIESVISQSYKNYEIIVVDDNGIDSENRKITEEFMKQYSDKSFIKYIKHDKNLGGCAARNTGIRSSKGELIGFLDDDDEWNKEFLEKMINKFNDKDIDVVYCNMHIELNGNIICLKKREEIFYKGDVFEKLLSGWCPASTSLFMIRRTCFDKIGYFDEKLKSFQDYDMWLRLSQNYKFDYIKERLIIKHEGHGGEQVGFNPYNREKALKYLSKKWHKKLNKNQTETFKNFIKLHSTIIKRNMVVYNKQKKIKCDYLKLYYEYVKTDASMLNKISLFLIIVFGTNILNIKYKVRYLIQKI